jgi:hypothetical protein
MDARHTNVFSDTFGQHRRPRPDCEA